MSIGSVSKTKSTNVVLKGTPKTKATKKTTKTFNQLFVEFQKANKVRNLSPATIKFYDDCFERFRGFYASESVKGINSGLLDDYVLYLQENCNDISSATYVRGLRAFLYYMMKMEYLDSFKIQLPKVQEPIKETYTDAELIVLLKKPNIKDTDFAELRNWVVINFLLGTGCRAATLCAVKVQDIDFESGLIQYSKTKNKRSAAVPLSHELSKVLGAYFQHYHAEGNDPLFPAVSGEHLTVDGLSTAIQRYNHKRGVLRTSLHAFRHTFAKTWIMNGGDIFRLQKLLGHSTLDMVRHYVNIYGQDLQKDYDRFNPLAKFGTSKGSRLKLNR